MGAEGATSTGSVGTMTAKCLGRGGTPSEVETRVQNGEGALRGSGEEPTSGKLLWQRFSSSQRAPGQTRRLSKSWSFVPDETDRCGTMLSEGSAEGFARALTETQDELFCLKSQTLAQLCQHQPCQEPVQR